VTAAATDLPLVDAHQHFWDPPRTPHPWLSTAPLADFRYGDYSALRRRYLPPDLLDDASGHRVVATVHVEAEWDTHDEVGETRWLATLRAAPGLPTVAIGHACFDDPGVDAVLAGHGSMRSSASRSRSMPSPGPSGKSARNIDSRGRLGDNAAVMSIVTVATVRSTRGTLPLANLLLT
jgi:predicted TIM-barrel fold metal-dependent hydrolase